MLRSSERELQEGGRSVAVEAAEAVREGFSSMSAGLGVGGGVHWSISWCRARASMRRGRGGGGNAGGGGALVG